ncbi:MAG: PH domain-containing protein [Acidimicrobiales bacterium]
MDRFAEEQPLPPAALTMVRVRWALRWGAVEVLLVAFAGLALAYGSPGSGVACLVIAAALAAAWWYGSALRVQSYRWWVTEATVELRHGVIVRRHSALPLAGVQNVTVSSGPVARAKGLATVTVHSAGADTPNITIPDLEIPVADELRDALLAPVNVPA